MSPERTSDVARAAARLAEGGLVAFPTETVYGLGADASRPEAVRQIFAVKGRPVDHPLIVHVADASHLPQWSAPEPGTADRARAVVEAFWPGPLTLVLPVGPDVPPEVTGGRPTVALRSPAHPMARNLLTRFGRGVAAPSANRFGAVSPTTADHVVEGLAGADLLVLDGGPCPVGVESTILDLTGPTPVVLRRGGVSGGALARVLGTSVPSWDGEGPATAPGMMAHHYAPQARVVLARDEAAALAAVLAHLPRVGPTRVGVLAPDVVGGLPDGVVDLGPAGDPAAYAHGLYARLHDADRLGLGVLVVVPPGGGGIGAAVRDRLRRASAGSGGAAAV